MTDLYEKKLHVARSEAEKYLSSSDVDSVFIGGSLTAGLGNVTSDIDLFVIVNDKSRCRDTCQTISAGNRVDTEVYTVEEIQAAIAGVCAFEFRVSSSPQVWKMEDSLDLVSRFQHGVFVKESETIQRLRAFLRENASQFNNLLTNYWALDVEANKEDFLGASLDGDYDTAALAGQGLVSAVGKAIVSSLGDTYFGKKWVCRQLARTAPEGLSLPDFLEYQSGSWKNSASSGALAVLYFVQDCLLAAQLNATSGSHSISRLCEKKNVAAGYHRHPGYTVFSEGGKVLLHWELNKQFYVSTRMAWLWGICQGLTLSEIRAEISDSPLLSEVFHGADDGHLESMLKKMEGMGLISLQGFALTDALAV